MDYGRLQDVDSELKLIKKRRTELRKAAYALAKQAKAVTVRALKDGMAPDEIAEATGYSPGEPPRVR